jgi:acetoin utilization protein AcuC
MSLSKPDVQEIGSLFVYSDEMSRFDFGPDHPFKAERAHNTYELCMRYGLMDHPWIKTLKPEPIETTLLTLFHEPEYIHFLEEASQGNISLETLERGLGTEDNPVLPGIYEWSLLAAGGTYEALDYLMKGDVLIAFNPLGGFHHGMPGHAEGFCYVNDISIALMDAIERLPEQRIVYLDIDAHHGNGVQEAFYKDPRVLVISVHETGKTLYPWSGYETEIGEGEGMGFTVNFPLESGSDDEVFNFALDEAVFPLIKAFSPHMIVALVGADTLISDPLTHLKLTNNSYRRAVREMTALCPRILALGGGGYDLYRTARCWTLAWSVLNNLEPTDEFAGLVGGMMFGPEQEVGSLYDHPYLTQGENKDKAMAEAKRTAAYIRKEIFPVHGL